MRYWSSIMLLFIAFLSFGQEADSLENKSDFAVYPVIGYAPETGGQFGAIAFFVFEDKIDDGINRPSSLTPFAVYTTRNQIFLVNKIDYYFKNGNNLNANARYYNFPDRYFGIGNDASENNEEEYTDRYFRIDGRFTKAINKNFFTGVYFDLQYNNILDIPQGGLLNAESPVGTSGGFNIGIGPGMQYDTRDNTLYPNKGKLINIGVTAFTKAFGSEYDYLLYLVDYRQYFKFLGPRSLLAFQFQSRFTSGSEIPFYKLNPIGGDERLRGIAHQNLYRDRQSTYFQIEARQKLFWRLGAVAFAGVGQVFDEFSNFNIENSRFVYGIGGRFQAIKGQDTNIRMDLGFSDEGQMAIYLGVSEAF